MRSSALKRPAISLGDMEPGLLSMMRVEALPVESEVATTSSTRAIGSQSLLGEDGEEPAESYVPEPAPENTVGEPVALEVADRLPELRKIVVIDGKEAWVGGLNVGDEYKGLDVDHLVIDHIQVRDRC